MNVLNNGAKSDPFDNDYANMITYLRNITFDDENGGDGGMYGVICYRYLKKGLIPYSI